mmetsp:Transcript_6726/g.19672  ORF Transcript_6726/g.19672 Transcript_6726/m.19672 type:complete len:251 (-) Transcript_6726:2807-3559(-)
MSQVRCCGLDQHAHSANDRVVTESSVTGSCGSADNVKPMLPRFLIATDGNNGRRSAGGQEYIKNHTHKVDQDQVFRTRLLVRGDYRFRPSADFEVVDQHLGAVAQDVASTALDQCPEQSETTTQNASGMIDQGALLCRSLTRCQLLAHHGGKGRLLIQRRLAQTRTFITHKLLQHIEILACGIRIDADGCQRSNQPRQGVLSQQWGVEDETVGALPDLLGCFQVRDRPCCVLGAFPKQQRHQKLFCHRIR